MGNVILFFVKYPQAGQVKTRLAAEVGHEQAASIYRRLVEAICRLMPENCGTLVFFDPPGRRTEIEGWLRPLLKKSVQFFPQCEGSLGARLTHAVAQVFGLGYGKIAVIGSDCVEISGATFEETWRALDSHDCVIGPSHDGGYYLLALRSAQPRLFEDIEWSSDAVLRQTLDRAREIGLSVHLLPKLHDVDTENDWRRASAHLISTDGNR